MYSDGVWSGSIRISEVLLYYHLVIMSTVIDVITVPEKINSTSKGRIFRAQKIALSPAGA